MKRVKSHASEMSAEERDLLYRFFGSPPPLPIPEPGSGGDPTHGRRRLCVSECRSVDADVMALNFLGSWEGEPGPQRVEIDDDVCDLVPAATPLGGFRWWWVCPICEERRKALYRPPWVGSSVACRVCHRLSYRLSQTNRRPRKRDAKLDAKLGLPAMDWGMADWAIRTWGRLRKAHARRLRYRRERAAIVADVARNSEPDV